MIIPSLGIDSLAAKMRYSPLLVDLATAFRKGDKSVVGALNDALIDAGFPLVAFRHFGRARTCVPGEGHCSAISAILHRNETGGTYHETLENQEASFRKEMEEFDAREKRRKEDAEANNRLGVQSTDR